MRLVLDDLLLWSGEKRLEGMERDVSDEYLLLGRRDGEAFENGFLDLVSCFLGETV